LYDADLVELQFAEFVFSALPEDIGEREHACEMREP
jgi:hypothetical protein